jgi:uncharacterized protein YuzE
MSKKDNQKLYYYYDRDADVFYLSQGKPSRSDRSLETSDDVVVRTNPRTGKVRGFTILNFTRRMTEKHAFVSLPLHAELTPV